MAKKKLLFMEDLIQLFEQKNISHFSSTESGYQLAVHVPMDFSAIEDYDDETAKIYSIRAFHLDKNRNGSSVPKKAADKAMKNMAYKPVLASFVTYTDPDSGEEIEDFGSHDFIIREDESIEYVEHQIGCFTADKPYYEEADGRTYICAKICIPNEYTSANEIIARKGGTKMSVELLVNELQYDSSAKVLELTDITVQGITCLGMKLNKDGIPTAVEEGMKGAGISLEDFSAKNNSTYSTDEKLFEVLEKLNTTLSNFNIEKNEGKEDMTSMHNNDAKENFDQEEVITETEEAIETEDETVETAEEFEEKPLDDAPVAAPETEENEETDDEASDNADVEEEAEADTETADEAGETDEAEDVETYCVNYSIGDMNFSVSLDQIIYSLNVLVNETYSEADNTYYSVQVFADDKNVVMIDTWTGTAYRQSYKERKGVYSLTGDRIPVHACWLTDDEEAKLDSMKSNYAEISEKLEKYETEPQKLDILDSEDYTNIKDVEEFAELRKKDNHFDLSVEEIKEKCDAILLEYAKGNKIEFSHEDKETSAKRFAKPAKASTGRYGKLFSKKK